MPIQGHWSGSLHVTKAPNNPGFPRTRQRAILTSGPRPLQERWLKKHLVKDESPLFWVSLDTLLTKCVKVTEEEWRHFVREERLSASVDFPSSLFWKDLLKIYPKAKVSWIFQKTPKLLRAGIAQWPGPSAMVRVGEEHHLADTAAEEQPGCHLQPPPSGSWFDWRVDRNVGTSTGPNWPPAIHRLNPFPPAGDGSDWSDIHGDCGKGKITDVEVKIEIKNDTSLRLFVMLLHLWALVACLVLLSKVKRKLSSFIRPGKPRLF